MKTIFIFLLSFLPALIKNPIFKAFGLMIEKGATIGFGSVLIVENLSMQKNTKIGPLSIVKAKSLEMKSEAKISSLVFIKCRKVFLDEYSKMSPLSIVLSGMEKSSNLYLGKHSQIFPFCWIEPGEGVIIGSDTGIGGHTLIFTHGVWSDYLKDGPVKHAPVKIGDHVWLPWRVFVMPGTKIADNSVIAAGSVVSNETEIGSLYGGMPAKLIKRKVIKELSPEEKENRAMKIITEFNSKFPARLISINEFNKDTEIVFSTDKVDKNLFNVCKKNKIDLIDYEIKTYFFSKNPNEEFLFFLRRYGIRLGMKKY